MNLNRAKIFFYIVLLSVFCIIAKAEDTSKHLYVFGDSLSDTGNVYSLTKRSGFPIPLPPSARYSKGRFSNGANAAEKFWEKLGNEGGLVPILKIDPREYEDYQEGVRAINFAFGGAESGLTNSVLGQFNVSGLLGQVGTFTVFKAGHPALKDDLALLWVGGNDYINQFITGSITSTEIVVGNIAKAIKILYASGIHNFVIPNLPDLGNLPIAYILGEIHNNTSIPSQLSASTVDHNAQLEQKLDSLKSTLPRIKIVKVDIYTLANSIVGPQDIIPGPAAGCLYNPGGATAEACSPVDFKLGNNKVYWDEIHPTAFAHNLFAEEMIRSLNQ